jgi:DNA-binding SARP family transcriptional activator
MLLHMNAPGAAVPPLIATLRLSGAPRMTGEDGAERAFEPKDALLLAWLALEGPTPRARLAALLFPDVDEAHARNNLRQRLFQLRRKCFVDLVSGDSTLQLAAGIAVLSDDGELLYGVDAKDLDELGEWLAAQRRDHSARSIATLAAKADQAEAAGDLDEALEHSNALVQAQPDSEHAYQRLMRLHYLRGDRGSALAAYDRCSIQLRDQLAAEPSASTRALRASIERAQPLAIAARAGLPITMLRPPRLVGREREILLAQAGWEAGKVLAVTGEAGMGKSRLLQELAAAVGNCAAAAARPGDAVVPYGVLSRLVGAVAKAVPLRSDGQSVAVALQELPGAEGGALVPAGAALPARVERGVRDLLAAAAERGLRAVVLDDLHFADEASVELLIPLAQAEELGDLRIAFAYRDVGGQPGLRRLEDTLQDAQRLAVVPLQPLDVREMREFIDALRLELDDGVADRLAQQLHHHTGGNPLFALETLRQAWSEQTLGRGVLPRPLNVGRLIERRLARLTPAALRLARCAAVAGADFSIDLAARVLNVAALDLADAWRELEDAQVLRDASFAHDLILEGALASVPPPIARHLHGEIAAYLAEQRAPPARLAAHWDRAQRWAAAAVAYGQSAQQARAGGRRVEEAAFLADAARCHAAAHDAPAYFEALLLRADVLSQMDLTSEAESAVAAVEAAAQSEEERLRATLARIVLENSHSTHETVLSRGPEAIARARALDRMDLVLPLSIHLAETLADARRGKEALALLAPLRDWVDSAATEEQRFDYFMALGYVHDYGNRLAESLPVWQTARSAAERARRPDLVWQSMANMAATHSKLGHVRLSAELGLQALQSARAHAEIPAGRLMQAQCTLAHRLRDLGRYREALALLEEALSFFRQGQVRSPSVAMAVHRLAQTFQQLGQPARAQALLAPEPGTLSPALAMMRHVHRADLAQQLGSSKLALQEIRTALAQISDPEDVYYRVGTLFATGIVAPDEAESLATSLAAWASAHQRFGLALAGHARAARAALAQHAVLRALPHVEAALRLGAEYQPDSFYLPEMWLVAGRVYAAAGHTSEAVRAVDEGATWVRRVAQNDVPEHFVDSFLNRNAVNLELLQLSARQAGRR